MALSVPSFLARDRIIAGPGFSRWLIPPAALAVHLCIGQVYATSVYKTSLIEHFGASQTTIGLIFSVAIVMLGISAGFGGTWVDRTAPARRWRCPPPAGSAASSWPPSASSSAGCGW